MLRNDPSKAIRDAIWSLIEANSYPEDNRTGYSRKNLRQTPVTDVLVQTFYVVYPDTSPLLDAIEIIDEEKVATEILEQMLSNPNETYDPYVSDRIGEGNWADAKSRGPEKQIERMRDIRLVEVIKMPMKADANAPIRVVGRESLAVEVSRLRERSGRDPLVIASVSVEGPAVYVNPHLREYSTNTNARRSQEYRICILEGRTTRQYIIGSHPYDDIEVPGMYEHENYLFIVSSASISSTNRPIMATLINSHGEEVPPNPKANEARYTWRLERYIHNNTQTGDNNEGEASKLDGKLIWNVRLVLSTSPQPLARFVGAPEIPPSIVILARVLPRRNADIPSELRRYLSSTLDIDSAIELEREKRIFLYTVKQDNDCKIYLLNRNQDLSVNVIRDNGQQVSEAPGGYSLEHGTKVAIGDASGMIGYTWQLNSIRGITLPLDIIGGLEYDNPHLSDLMEAPRRETDVKSWMIGNWKYGAAAADELGCKPVLHGNPDPYIGRYGNLIIRYNDRDRQGHPQFRLTLKETERAMQLFVKAGSSWQSLPWNPFTEGELLRDIPDINIVGEENYLIFGTSYYWIKTSGTKHIRT